MIYLLHSNVPLTRGAGLNVRHYLGYANDATYLRRVQDHQRGRSKVKIVQAFLRRGATLTLVKTWKNGGPALERYLKQKGHLDQHCPLCRPQYLERVREHSRHRREMQRVQQSAQWNGHARATGGGSPAPKAGTPGSPSGASLPARPPDSSTPLDASTSGATTGGDPSPATVKPSAAGATPSAGTKLPSG